VSSLPRNGPLRKAEPEHLPDSKVELQWTARAAVPNYGRMNDRFILIRSGPGGHSTWPLSVGDNRIGRDAESEVVLKDSSVSREHALVQIGSDGAQIRDVGSRNGSWLNGIPIDETMPLRPGDQIQVGDVVFQFRRESDNDTATGPVLIESATRLPWEDLRSSVQSIDTPRGEFWQAIIEAAQLMVLPQPASELLPTMFDLVESVVPADRILLLLRDEEDDHLDLVASRPEVDSAEDLPLSKTLVDAVIGQRESVLVEDVPNDPDFAAAQSMADLGLKSAMAAPLFDNERVIGLIYADTRRLSQQLGDTQLRAFTMLANLIAIKLTNARLLEEHREMQRLEQEMAAAGKIQQGILPAELPEIPGYERLAELRPCLQMAGDFYDMRILDDETVFLIVGDVSGKGSGAALLMSHFLAAFRVLVGEGISVAALGEKLNEHLFESSDPTHYITLWMGHLDPRTHRLTYLNAGHNPPLLRDAVGSWTTLPNTALPIGMLEFGEFRTDEVELEPGSLLCVYTDGLVEARSGEEFFGEDGLQHSLAQHGDRPLDDVIDLAFADVQAYLGAESFDDDCTLMLLRRPSA